MVTQSLSVVVIEQQLNLNCKNFNLNGETFHQEICNLYKMLLLLLLMMMQMLQRSEQFSVMDTLLIV